MIRLIIVTVLLTASLTSSAERVVAVLPSCAKMIPRRGDNEVREVKSLLLNDADAIDWKFTKWDVEMVASADAFVSIGLPGERHLVDAVKNIKSGIMIVDAGMGLKKIDGNPYFFISSDNLASIKANMWRAFDCKETILCGPPQTTPSIMRPYFVKKSYVVAIAHPVFEYECESYGVECILIEFDRLDTDECYRHAMVARLKKGKANILLSLPGYSRAPKAFLMEARLRNVEFDVYNGGLSNLGGVLFQNAMRRESDLEEYVDREKSHAVALLAEVRFARFEVPENATVQSVLDRLQAAIEASDKIDLPRKKRKLKIDFSLYSDAKDMILGPFVLENVSGVEVLSEVCAKVNCRFSECSHATCSGDDFGVLYIVRDSVGARCNAIEDEE